MPWTEVRPMDERIRFVVEAGSGAESMSWLCRKYGISRKTGYKWLNRAQLHGIFALSEHSRAPRNCPHRTPIEMREALIALRKANPSWGPKKIASEVSDRFGLRPPAPSTIALIFQKEGLSKPRRRRNVVIRNWSNKLTKARHPNHVWTMDYKGWFELPNRKKCWPFTVMDLHSRYVLACDPLAQPALAPTQEVCDRVFSYFGLPQIIRVDNGIPFASCAAGGISRLSAQWLRLGITVEFIEPGKPQQNGAHERMHRSLKRELRRADTLRRQRRRCQTWRRIYNHSRGHEALGMRTPAALYAPSSRRPPRILPDFVYPSEYILRRVKRSGSIQWRGHHRFISQSLHRCTVGLLPNQKGGMNIYAGSIFLGVLNDSDTKGLVRP